MRIARRSSPRGAHRFTTSGARPRSASRRSGAATARACTSARTRSMLERVDAAGMPGRPRRAGRAHAGDGAREPDVPVHPLRPRRRGHAAARARARAGARSRASRTSPGAATTTSATASGRSRRARSATCSAPIRASPSTRCSRPHGSGGARRRLARPRRGDDVAERRAAPVRAGRPRDPGERRPRIERHEATGKLRRFIALSG